MNGSRNKNRNPIGSLISEALLEYNEASRDVVVWYLDHVYGIKLEEADREPERFVKALHDMFGSFESVVEKTVCIGIADEYGIKYSDQGFVALMKELKNVT